MSIKSTIFNLASVLKSISQAIITSLSFLIRIKANNISEKNDNRYWLLTEKWQVLVRRWLAINNSQWPESSVNNGLLGRLETDNRNTLKRLFGGI